MALRAYLLIGIAAAALATAGCGGTDTAGDADAPAVGGQAGELRDEAEAVLSDLEREVGDLADARSLEDVGDAVERARARIDEAQDRTRALDLEDEEAQARDRLDTTLADLESDLERVEEAARDDDLRRTLREASAVSVRELREAVAEVRAATDAG